MDNTMFMHHDRTAAMRKVLDDVELFGKPTHVTSCFTIPFGLEDDWAKDNIRMQRSMEPLGCLGDLGWYCVRVSLWTFGYEDPEAVQCHFLEETSEGVPISCTAILKFSGGRTASFDCSFKHCVRQSMQVAGPKCTLNADDFVVPFRVDESSFTVYRESISKDATTFPREVLKAEEVKGCVQHVRLVEKLSAIAASGETEDFWPKVAMQTQILMGALVQSVRRGGAWVTPREPSGKAGAAKAAAEAAPVVKKQATFTNIKEVQPQAQGLNLQVKVVSMEPVLGATPMCTAVVGDASGIATLVVKGEAQVGLIKEDASLVLRNASVRMFNGFVRLQVDRWGKLELSEEAFAFTPNKDHDISATEYELVEEEVGEASGRNGGRASKGRGKGKGGKGGRGGKWR